MKTIHSAIFTIIVLLFIVSLVQKGEATEADTNSKTKIATLTVE